MANIKLNYTAFTSASMALKITAAMSHCLSTGEVVRVTNRRGKGCLLVATVKDRLGYTFRFFSMYGHEEVGDLILRASHSWPESTSRSFWQLAAASYELTEHPFITDSKKAYEVPVDITASGVRVFSELLEQQRTVDQIHKNLGATHKATDSLGRVVYLSYKRSWFGLGKTKTKLYETRFDALNGSWSSLLLNVNGSAFTIQGVL